MRKFRMSSLKQALFKQSTDDIQNMLDSLFKEQYELSKSPNFFYKGKTYIIVKGHPLKPLDDSLREKLKGILEIQAINTENQNQFNHLTNVIVGYPPEYLYYIFPEQAHYILEDLGIHKLHTTPKDLDDFIPDTLPQIHMLIKEQLLNSIL